MKTIFSNMNELAHAYSSLNYDYGKSGNIFFEGATSYSYGKHYAISNIIANDTGFLMLVNCDNYSNSTAKHKNAIIRACSHYNQIFVPFVDNYANNHSSNINYLFEQVKTSYNKALKARTNIKNNLYNYEQSIKNLNVYCRFFSLDTPNLEQFYFTQVELQLLYVKQENYIQNQLLKDKERAIKNIDKFFNYDINYFNSEYQYLRLNKNDSSKVETSKQVTINLNDCLSLYKLVLSCKEKEKELKDFNFSIYKNTYIDKQGNLFVNCHKFTFTEIQRFIDSLN